MNYYKEKVEEEEPECKLFLIGCKGDLERSVSGETVSKKYKGVKHFETSAKTGEGVQ